MNDSSDDLNKKSGVIDHSDSKELTDAKQKIIESEAQYRLLTTHMPMGLALHEIICDDSGKPIDYRFLSVNNEFERITGLLRQNIIGKRVLEILPNTEQSWINRYGEVALTGKVSQFEDYSAELKRYYSVSAYSPRKGQFAVIVNDITERKRSEEELLLKKKELDTYFNSSLDLLCIANTKGEFLRVNPEWKKVLGYSVRELEGSVFLNYVHPEDYESTIEALKALTNQEDIASFVNRYRRKDGNYRWIEWRSKSIGNLIYAAARDITKRVEKEERLIRLNNNQTLLIDVSSKLMFATPENLESSILSAMEDISNIITADRIYIFEHDFGKKVCNNTYEWCAEGIVSEIKLLQDFPHENMKEWLKLHLKGEVVIINDVHLLLESDPMKKVLMPQGIQSLITVPLFLGETLYGFIGFDSVKTKYLYTPDDVVFLKQLGNYLLSTIVRIKADKALKASEASYKQEKEKFETTLLSVGDGVISTDIDGNVDIINSVSERLTGWKQEEAHGKPLEEVFNILNDNTRERCDNPVMKVLETGEIIDFSNHTILVSRDGTQRPIEDSAAPIFNENGEISGVVLVFRDFTEKKKYQDEIQRLSYRDYLTGVYNRRFFETELQRLNSEQNLPLSIIMCDVNGLKLINDSLGHAVGDDLLKKASKALTKGFRSKDIIARVGGDEFAVLLPETNGDEVMKLISDVQELLSKEKINNLDVSVSFGYETKTSQTETIDLIFKQAEDDMYQNKLFDRPSIRGRMINTIVDTLNERSQREKNHSSRVSSLCEAIGQALKLDDLSIKKLRTLGLLHDIGKIAISDDILNKKGKLTAKEAREIRRHTEIGYRILSTSDEMYDIAENVLYHHERWDGKGYPKGISGENIPLFSRICAIADAFDAMTSERSYRAAKSTEYAVKELRNNSNTQFDPELINLFLDNVLPNLIM
jgi:diguanylate cyclase (GGDEF)-like protein/PAS domain S-box-containing protein